MGRRTTHKSGMISSSLKETINALELLLLGHCTEELRKGLESLHGGGADTQL